MVALSADDDPYRLLWKVLVAFALSPVVDVASETLTGGTVTAAGEEAATGGGGVVFVSTADERASSISFKMCRGFKFFYGWIARLCGFRIFLVFSPKRKGAVSRTN